MPTAYSRKIRSALRRSDSASTTNERGRILEKLVAEIFCLFPGVRHDANNQLNAAGSSEIDVCLWNNRVQGALDFMPNILVVECKNTLDPIGSPAVRIFKDKLGEMHLDHGILIASSGITGNDSDLSAAHDVIRSAFLQDKMRIIVITRNELEALSCTDDLVLLLQDKILRVTMRSTSFKGS